MKEEKIEFIHECECVKPEIRDSYKDAKCTEKQIIECHGLDYLKSIKKEKK